MKVICIDAKFYTLRPLLNEGDVYTVVGEPTVGKDAYLLKEVQHPNHPLYGFYKKRFVTLSDINETEFERNYNKQLA